MANYIRNFRWEVADGKTYLYMNNRPQYALDINNNWVDLEVEYASVIDYVEIPGQDIPEELLLLHNEYKDIYDLFYLVGELPDVIVDTDNPDILDAWTRTDSIKQIEESNGILYPREIVWVDGAPNITGIIILPHDDYSDVYTINEDGTIEYLDEYVEGIERPYYIKENGKTYMYVNHFSGGAGTQADPYLISTPAELDAIRNNRSAYYKLTNHIDMSEWGNWTPIADAAKYIDFTGSFDGDGYVIRNLTINSTIQGTGLFSVLSGSSSIIKNLGIENINYTVTGNSMIGGIVGYLKNTGGKIENCYTTGAITTNNYYSGGIVGYAYGIYIRNCWSSVSISSSSYAVGGIAGTAYGPVTIDKCHYCGNLLTGRSKVKGLVGDVQFTSVKITDCHWNTETTSISTGWTATKKPSNTTGTSGLTTTQMQTQSTFTGWDFNIIWTMNGYPQLQMFKPQYVAGQSTFTIIENIIGYNTINIYDIDTDFNKGIYTNTKVVDGKLTLNKEGE